MLYCDTTGCCGHLRAHFAATWLERSVSHPTTHNGTKIDLLGVAPQTVGFDQVTLVWTDRSAHWGNSKAAFLAGNPSLADLWETGRMVPLAPKRARQVGFPRHLDTGQALQTSGLGRQLLPTMPRRARHDVSPLLRVPGLAGGAGHARLAGAAAGQHREQFARGCFPCPSQSLPMGARQQSCPVLWHNRPPDRLLEGHMFTYGCSSGSGALRRAGRAVVAVDDLGILKAAAHGAVPVDVLSEQTSLDGEDYAAAMAGPITMEPLTLHIDCAGTIATISGPKGKAPGPKGKGLMSGAGCSAPTTRSQRSRSRATRRRQTCRQGGPRFANTHKPPFLVARTVLALSSLAKQAARWAAEVHVVLHNRGWRDTRAHRMISRVKRMREDALAAPAAGDASD